jgi:hypothetical protein
MTFYQDVTVTAQVVTAFCLLDRRRWVWATVFMMAAMGVKATAILFLPAFLILLVLQRVRRAQKAARPAARLGKVVLPLVAVAALLWLPMQISDRLLAQYGGYYPFRQVKHMSEKVAAVFVPPAPAPVAPPVAPLDKATPPISPKKEMVIANHPGDLRQPANWLVYGGGLLWLVVGLGALRRLANWRQPVEWQRFVSNQWPLWVGLSFLLPTAWLLKTAPDARFFYPALPFVLLPFVESFARLPRQRIWMSLLVALAIVQSGAVLTKAVRLREITPELQAGMDFLKKHPPVPPRVFMYPEGSYRFFPVEHEWYLKHYLRDFWRGDNLLRLQLLVKRKVGAIVVKKHLVARVDDEITNLGVYPDYFVPQLEADPRFRKVFDNPAVAIYEFDATGVPLLD